MVSIIIPVCNTALYLDKCIDSIISQVYTDFEVLLLYGKSEDDSTEKCKKWVTRDDRIRVIEQKGETIGAARMQGAACSVGEYIAFVDSDDYIEPDFLSYMVEAMQSHKTDYVECDYYEEFEDGSRRGGGNSVIANMLSFEFAEIYGMPAMWKRIIHRSLWEKAGIDISSLACVEDLAIYHLIMRNASYPVFLSKKLYHYRVRTDSISNSKDKFRNIIDSLMQSMSMVLDSCRGRESFEKEKSLLLRQFEVHGFNTLNLRNGEITAEEYRQMFVEYGKKMDAEFGGKWQVRDDSFFSMGSSITKRIGYHLCRNIYKPCNTLSPMNMMTMMQDEIWDKLKDVLLIQKPKVILLDLTGEITLSEFFGTKEYADAFRGECERLNYELKDLRFQGDIILVPNCYAYYRKKGWGWETHPDPERIEFINEVISDCYCMANNALEGSVLLERLPQKLYFCEQSDDKPEHWEVDNSLAVLYYTEQVFKLFRENKS